MVKRSLEMTEQDLTALAQDVVSDPPPGHLLGSYANLVLSLAQGYLALLTERDAIREELDANRLCNRFTWKERATTAEAERDALKAQLEARSSDDEPDITIGAEPWTDEQLADMRAIAISADLRQARELVEASGFVVSEPVAATLGPPVPACPHCAFHEPEWFPEAGCWLCNHCMRHLDQITHYRQVLTPDAAEATA